MNTSLNQISCMDVLKLITKCHCVELDQTSHSEVPDLDLHWLSKLHLLKKL